jgi:hypothetical protein
MWQGNAKQLAKLPGVAYNSSDKVVQYWSPEIPRDTVYNGSRGRMRVSVYKRVQPVGDLRYYIGLRSKPGERRGGMLLA